MISDEFPVCQVRYRGHAFRCTEHARWHIFFDQLRLDADYQPLKFEYDFPGTERYRLGSETRTCTYQPTFYLHGHGFVHITTIRPMGATLQAAERLADKHDEPVFILEGEPEVPRSYLTTNAVTVCHGQTPPKHGYRMLHDGRKFRFGLPKVQADVLAIEITEAALCAESLR